MSEQMPEIERVLALGPEWTYSDILAKQLYPEHVIEYGETFDGMMKEAMGSPEIAVLLPIVNTLDGAVNPNIRNFMTGRLMVEQAAVLDVVSNILGLGELDDLEVLASNAKALGQVTQFMPQLERKTVVSTGEAAAMIREENLTTVAAVGAGALAGAYGLNVLAGNVSDTIGDGINETTMLVARGRNGHLVTPSVVPGGRVQGVMRFSTKDSSKQGALLHALQPLDDFGVNLSNIESVVVPGTRRREFFATFEADGGDMVAMQEDQAATEMYIDYDLLGVYPQAKTYSSEADLA